VQGRQGKCRVGKKCRVGTTEGAVFELGRDPREGATQLGGWVAVSRFLKFPILGNFAEIEKSRLRPSGRTFPRLAVGGYTRRSDGEQWERASSKTARSSLPSGSLLQVWARTYRACPAWKAPPSGGSRPKTFCGRAALATGRGTFPRLALRRAPSSNSYSDVIAWSPYGLPGSQR
jgi:hypothetical protein